MNTNMTVFIWFSKVFASLCFYVKVALKIFLKLLGENVNQKLTNSFFQALYVGNKVEQHKGNTYALPLYTLTS